MTKKIKILLVDPDVRGALQVVDLLSEKGFYISHLASLDNVLTAVLKNAYQVIIMATSFKKEETHEVIQKIKMAASDISIIAAVKESTPELEKRIRAHGIAFFMDKPIQIDLLQQVLDRMLVVHRHF